jgi:molecular chaperone Hsp33
MSTTDKQQDSLHRFLFEGFPVRGELVRLDATWQAATEHTDYPPAVRSLLGQTMAAASLLASTLKFRGAMTVQLQGDGPVSLVVVQCSSDLHLRGTAQFSDETPDNAGFEQLVGKGNLAITIEQEDSDERYQGLVPLEGKNLAAALEAYFERSEQIPTRLWLSAGEVAAAGLLLQIIPGEETEEDDDAWDRAVALADTVTGPELTDLPIRQLLHRLYHEEDVRLFEPFPVAFRCRCSRDNIASVLRGLGQPEVRSIVEDEGHVEVTCEFCGRQYHFDPVDAENLFTDPADSQQSRSRH